ncbi:MAG: hypothetical protein V5A38_11350 [Halolamina sp.]|uniref:hypothetical protein n=1 Tax=Halolamina sp. TaxID=1940283 RepID=UPI002FC3CB04
MLVSESGAIVFTSGVAAEQPPPVREGDGDDGGAEAADGTSDSRRAVPYTFARSVRY